MNRRGTWLKHTDGRGPKWGSRTPALNSQAVMDPEPPSSSGLCSGLQVCPTIAPDVLVTLFSLLSLRYLYWFARAAITKSHRLEDLNNRTVFSPSSRGETSEVKVSA